MVFGAILVVLLIQVIRIELRAAGSTKTPEEWRALMKQRPYERRPTDARSPCPMLNLLANHGFLPRDGRRITKSELFDALVLVGAPPTITYTFLSTVVFRIYHRVEPNQSFSALFQATPTIDLDQLAIHNLIEHDVSLTRHDIDQAPHDVIHPHADLVRRIHQWSLLQQNVNAHGQIVLDMQGEHDLRKIRWYESAAQNPKGHLGLLYQFSSSAECALMLDILGRDGTLRADHIEPLLLHERFPEDWYPREKAYPALQALLRPLQCLNGIRKSAANLDSLQALSMDNHLDNS
ncbi:Chloroperoxidase [Chlamydoabsidia padenii]|nr:Chloroperoxidase [Chlamydoabsidia padenii]